MVVRVIVAPLKVHSTEFGTGPENMQVSVAVSPSTLSTLPTLVLTPECCWLGDVTAASDVRMKILNF